jgi:hypothetical protein
MYTWIRNGLFVRHVKAAMGSSNAFDSVLLKPMRATDSAEWQRQRRNPNSDLPTSADNADLEKASLQDAKDMITVSWRTLFKWRGRVVDADNVACPPHSAQKSE